jgi:hypothetical protein
MEADAVAISSNPPSSADLLLAACPFLRGHRDEYWHCGDTIVFGDVARLLRRGQLAEDQTLAVFDFFNSLAESGDAKALEVLTTGALETFNDDAASQRLARCHLRGKALSLLEEMRVYWGQPDYGGV